MRIVTAAIAVALLTVTAHAQGLRQWPKPEHKRSMHKTRAQERKKATDKAYKDALKKIPKSNTPVDPWKGMR